MEDQSCQLLTKNCPLALHLHTKAWTPSVWDELTLCFFVTTHPTPATLISLYDSYTPDIFKLRTQHQLFSLLEGSSLESHLAHSLLSFKSSLTLLLRPQWHLALLLPQLLYHFIFLYSISHPLTCCLFNHLLVYCISPHWSLSTMRAGIFYFVLFMTVSPTSRTVPGI